jgi:hypothetical protein
MSCVLATHGDPAPKQNFGTGSISNSVLLDQYRSPENGCALSMTAELIITNRFRSPDSATPELLPWGYQQPLFW